jgi:hypothetical protein
MSAGEKTDLLLLFELLEANVAFRLPLKLGFERIFGVE